MQTFGCALHASPAHANSCGPAPHPEHVYFHLQVRLPCSEDRAVSGDACRSCTARIVLVFARASAHAKRHGWCQGSLVLLPTWQERHAYAVHTSATCLRPTHPCLAVGRASDRGWRVGHGTKPFITPTPDHSSWRQLLPLTPVANFSRWHEELRCACYGTLGRSTTVCSAHNVCLAWCAHSNLESKQWPRHNGNAHDTCITRPRPQRPTGEVPVCVQLWFHAHD